MSALGPMWECTADTEFAGEPADVLGGGTRTVPPELPMRDVVDTSALDLQGLFVCQRFGPLPHRACLRRQLERQESTKRGIKGPSVREYCATACEQGRVIRAGLAHVAARTCADCGSALIGLEPKAPCPTCVARAIETTGRAPGKSRAEIGAGSVPELTCRPPQQDRIWQKDFVEPPFVPPRAPHVAVEKQATPQTVHPEIAAAQAPDRRSGPVAVEASEVVHPLQTQETTMACPECKSPTCHKITCSRRPAKGAKPAAVAKTQQRAVALARETAAASDVPALLVPSGPLADMDLPDLLALRGALTSELRRRREDAAKTLAALDQAIAKDAAA